MVGFKTIFICLLLASCSQEAEYENVLGLKIYDFKDFKKREIVPRDYSVLSEYESFISKDSLSTYYFEIMENKENINLSNLKKNIKSHIQSHYIDSLKFVTTELPYGFEIHYTIINEEFGNKLFNSTVYCYNENVFYDISFQYVGNDESVVSRHHLRIKNIDFDQNNKNYELH